MKGKQSYKIAACALVLSVFSIPFEAHGEGLAEPNPGTARVVLTIEQGLVGLQSREAPLSEILRSISEQTGMTVIFDPEAESRVTTEMKAVPFDAAMGRLLKSVNYAALWPRAVEGMESASVAPVKLFVYPKNKSAIGPYAVTFYGKNSVLPLGQDPQAPRAELVRESLTPMDSARDSTARQSAPTLSPYPDKRMQSYLKKKDQLRREFIQSESEGSADSLDTKPVSDFIASLKLKNSRTMFIEKAGWPE